MPLSLVSISVLDDTTEEIFSASKDSALILASFSVAPVEDALKYADDLRILSQSCAKVIVQTVIKRKRIGSLYIIGRDWKPCGGSRMIFWWDKSPNVTGREEFNFGECSFFDPRLKHSCRFCVLVFWSIPVIRYSKHTTSNNDNLCFDENRSNRRLAHTLQTLRQNLLLIKIYLTVFTRNLKRQKFFFIDQLAVAYRKHCEHDNDLFRCEKWVWFWF